MILTIIIAWLAVDAFAACAWIAWRRRTGKGHDLQTLIDRRAA